MSYLSRLFNRYNPKELVYIPYGSDKGDCPYCLKGVLRRDENIERKLEVKEGYLCTTCWSSFTEVGRRYFYYYPINKKKLNTGI